LALDYFPGSYSGKIMDGQISEIAGWASVRSGLVGVTATLRTPYGERPLIYADFTASGRALRQVEDAVADLHTLYANPHTEDSETGRASGAWLREAEAVIRRCINADEGDALITCASGATGAIHKLQEILGITLPPASADRLASLEVKDRPVVFIGPYEHHSNELSWRESLAEVVTVPLNECGDVDLMALEEALHDPAYEGRLKIGAFSAASNVTGLKTDLVNLAQLLHEHDAILCVDAAASAPYARIDMHPAEHQNAQVDAVYFSPHKFLGGPGACGVLAFSKSLYRKDLPPTQSAGGTVRYVWKDGHDFIEDVEARERAGTPGVPQVVRAALAMQIQAEIGFELIEDREQAALMRAFEVWRDNPGIEILGPECPTRRLGIVSFNIRDRKGELVHPRLVTVLLNDLFGIQSRAGCSCAGPYGHDLLGISDEDTQRIRAKVLDGEAGARPGWCRVSLHWAMSEEEIGYLIEAIGFLGQHGWKFVEQYRFDPASGQWEHKTCRAARTPVFPSSILTSTPREMTRSRSRPVRELMREAMSVANSAVL